MLLQLFIGVIINKIKLHGYKNQKAQHIFSALAYYTKLVSQGKAGRCTRNYNTNSFFKHIYNKAEDTLNCFCLEYSYHTLDIASFEIHNGTFTSVQQILTCCSTRSSKRPEAYFCQNGDSWKVFGLLTLSLLRRGDGGDACCLCARVTLASWRHLKIKNKFG